MEHSFGNGAIRNIGAGSTEIDGVRLVINGVLTPEGELWVDRPGSDGDAEWPPPGWPDSPPVSRDE